jgi:hypothetical protein
MIITAKFLDDLIIEARNQAARYRQSHLGRDKKKAQAFTDLANTAGVLHSHVISWDLVTAKGRQQRAELEAKP